MRVGAVAGVASGYAISWLTGSEYSWQDAAGVGLAGKLGKLGRLAVAAEESGVIATAELRATHGVSRKAVGRLAADIG